MRPFHAGPMLDSKPFASLARALSPLLIALPLLSGCGAAASAEGAPKGGGDASPPPPNGESASFLRVGDVHKQPAGGPSDQIVNEDAKPTATATAAAASAAPRLPGNEGPAGTRAVDPQHKRAEDKGTELQLATTPGGAKSGVHGATVDDDGLSEAEVRGAIVQGQGSFRECYEIGMRASSGFSGKVSLRVSITSAGTVGSVEVTSSTTKNSGVDSCVAEAVRKIKFPAKGNGAVVGFPIEFGG